jgi:hypothetical protein
MPVWNRSSAIRQFDLGATARRYLAADLFIEMIAASAMRDKASVQQSNKV